MMELGDVYQRDSFIKFLQNDFLPDFKKDIRSVNLRGLSSIKSASYLGECIKLDLQVFEFKFEGSPNKRVALTKDAFSVMRSSGIFNALAVFHSPDSKDWRFSLMTATPEPTEKGMVKLFYSNPKRLSFFLGPNAKINTPTKFLVTKGKVFDFEDLKNRFSIEIVNKEFYKEISTMFTKLVGGERKIGKKLSDFKALLKIPDHSPKENHQFYSEFAVRLIGRIIFCWFLREKKSTAGLSLMPDTLLSLKAVIKNENYYHKILEPIFFEVLNKPKKLRFPEFSDDLFRQIPYLNGGIFSQQDGDYYERTGSDLQSTYQNTLYVPNEWIEELFTILETYNFTIDENTSFDEELSIDPEMLGRIFENLLAEINPETGESARKSTGSYYTPRTIVNYMVDESLLLYLKNQTGVQENRLRAVISYDLNDDSENPVSLEDKEKIIEALEKIKILDPACGSGAFPIGALQKIVFILQQIDTDGVLWKNRQLSTADIEFKRDIEFRFSKNQIDFLRKSAIIRKCIFGVDIQPVATEISRLRCFLTLIVDEMINDNEENRGIKPLPNLDFKFVTANSLIGLPKTDIPQQSMFDDYKKIDELKKTRDQYFNSSGIEREQLKTQFVIQQKRLINDLIKEHGFIGAAKAELTQKLTNWEPFSHEASMWFDPEWMFGVKDGFDIVIANPPYVSYGLRGMQKMTAEERKILINNFPDSAEYKISIYSLFMDKAIQLAKINEGIQTLIVPDSFLLGRYFSKIRAKIIRCCEINHISWLPYKIFEATVGFSVVYTFVRKQTPSENHYIFSRYVHNNEEIAEKSYEEYSYKQLYFKNRQFNRFRLFFNKKTMDLVGKIEADSQPVGQYFTGRTGVRSLIGQKKILAKDAKGKTWQKGLISSAQIQKYKVIYSGDYINIDPSILNMGGWDYNIIHNQKVLLRQTADKLTAAIDNEGYYHLNNIHSFAPKNGQTKINLEYFLALINSKLMTWFYQTITLETGRVMAQTDIETIETLPIKAVETKQQKWLIDCVNKIIAITKDEDYLQDLNKQAQVEEYEKQIDQLFYKIYSLTPEEIKIVENN